MAREFEAEVQKEIEQFAPNVEPDVDRFMELYNSGQTFYQVIFYDRRFDYSGWNQLIPVTEEEKDKLVNELKTYNDKLKELVEKHGKENFLFTDIGDNFGYCHLHVLERSKERERIEEEEQRKAWDVHEPSCSACGDGGCVHCEPHRFI